MFLEKNVRSYFEIIQHSGAEIKILEFCILRIVNVERDSLFQMSIKMQNMRQNLNKV